VLAVSTLREQVERALHLGKALFVTAGHLREPAIPERPGGLARTEPSGDGDRMVGRGDRLVVRACEVLRLRQLLVGCHDRRAGRPPLEQPDRLRGEGDRATSPSRTARRERS
jgi:hypothetical protein